MALDEKQESDLSFMKIYNTGTCRMHGSWSGNEVHCVCVCVCV
jgi:hypothetical protein